MNVISYSKTALKPGMYEVRMNPDSSKPQLQYRVVSIDEWTEWRPTGQVMARAAIAYAQEAARLEIQAAEEVLEEMELLRGVILKGSVS